MAPAIASAVFAAFRKANTFRAFAGFTASSLEWAFLAW